MMMCVETKKKLIQVGALRFAKSLQGKLGTSHTNDECGDQEG